MKKRNLIIIVAVALMIAAATVITVYAYLQNTVNQPNRFVIEEGNVDVTETFTEPDVMTMSDTFTKVVSVKNSGTSDQFVRVYLDFSDSLVRDRAVMVYTKNDETQEKSWSGFLADLPEGWVYVDENDTDGALLGGYFYYDKILAAGQSTPPLIDGVKTNYAAAAGDTNVDNITDFDIVVYSESVQTSEIDASGTQYTDSQRRQAWRSFLSLSQ